MTELFIPNRPRHHRVLVVSPELILEMLRWPTRGLTVDNERIACTADPIPESAKIARCGINDRQEFVFILEDASFPPVPPASPIPVLQPKFTAERIDLPHDDPATPDKT